MLRAKFFLVLSCLFLLLPRAQAQPTAGQPRPSVIASIDSPRLPLDQSVLTSFPERDFRRDPPRVRTATVGRIPGASAEVVRLRVTFAEKGLPRQIGIEIEDGRLILRDDGVKPDEKAADGVFTANLRIPSKFLDTQLDAARRTLEGQKDDKPVEITLRRRSRIVNRIVIDRLAIERRLIPLIPPFGFPPPPPPGPPPPVDEMRSLMITNTGVVDDPTRTANPCKTSAPLGHWSFGFLMTEMANQPATGVSPSDFAKKWLQQWQAAQVINTFNVPARLDINADVLNPWIAASGGGPTLNMNRAPFRLLAIVNRIDLRDNVGYGAGAGGELRFVYGVMKGCNPTPFTVIFEYGVPPKTCLTLKAYAKAWQNLTTMVPGTPAYNAALQAITDPVVKRNAMPSKPNRNALNQLRTNEIELAAPWELREFRIENVSHLLRQTTVKQNPAQVFNNTATFRNFVNANLPAIHAGTYTVPLRFPMPLGPRFLGGAAPVPNPAFFWRGSPAIADNQARHLVSLGTCNGCHAGETQTAFTHIQPMVPIGTAATLSGFLTGINVPDPLLGAPVRHFDDLDERKADLQALTTAPCLFHGLFFDPLRMTH